ncbi:hypothetical protein PPACK8108_LOCUS21384 [Phakopsora pachyrhizi]|uniref:Uncharacterized protein n=1 Tax=Phakopsora pachyrhizi TaxID=170000 RepID=A0AAV0BJT4_PHAPC|nr:hypothetical protein PPACK8108_LOCUS21384 [Phakopsora pachyrhizi]
MPKLPSVSLPFVKKSQTRSQTRAQRFPITRRMNMNSKKSGTRPTNQASTSALIYQPQPPTGLMASLLFSAKPPSPSQLKSASNHSSTNPTPSIRPSYPENSGSITSPSLIRESENFSRRELFDPPHPIFHSSHKSDKHQPLPSEIPDTNHSQFNPPNAQSQMENSAQAFLGVHPSSADSIHLKLGETMLCDLQKSSPPLISLSPIGQPLLDSNIKHTSSGSRLARLEKHHALASMAEKDRKFYAQSNESSSLSGKESDEGIAALGGISSMIELSSY